MDVGARTPLTSQREADRLARLRRWQVAPTIHKVSHKADGAPATGSRRTVAAG